MLIIILLIIVIFILFNFFKNNKVNWSSFLHKGFRLEKGMWGNACYHGKQGSGKTSSVMDFIFDNVNEDYPLYANMKSIKGLKYTYFSGLQGFYDVINSGASNCIILFDEIFNLFPKGTKVPEEFFSFLSQMRKRKIYFITTAQEWLLINVDLRKFCRYSIKCKCFNIPFFGAISYKSISNAEEIKWSNEENEYVSPLICNTISKLNKSNLLRYDTYEVITQDYNPPVEIFTPLD